MSKLKYSKLLIETFIDSKFPLPDSIKKILWDPKYVDHSSFERIPLFSKFRDLNILKLAGDIDYALRDSYYCGRYSNSFDYRYFQTLVDIESENCQEEITESIRELYRSIYALNSVYGNFIRRLMALIFVRLTNFLIDNSFLQMDQFKNPIKYVELDDDHFMAIINEATKKAANSGYKWAKEMFEIVGQFKPVEVNKLEIANKCKIKSFEEIEQNIAKINKVDPIRVVAIKNNFPYAYGYTLFGKQFKSYGDAIKSNYFKEMTGLRKGTNRTGLLDDNSISYVII